MTLARGLTVIERSLAIAVAASGIGLAGCVQAGAGQPSGAFGATSGAFLTDAAPGEAAGALHTAQPAAESPASATTMAASLAPATPAVQPADQAAGLPTASSQVDSPVVAAAAVRSDLADRAADGEARALLERALRHELANGADPTLAACRLAGLLADRERHADALFVIETARRRCADPQLRVARADLLRDLARRQEALDELRSVVRDLGAAQVSPAVVRDLAELEWMALHRDEALAALRELFAVHAAHPWVDQNRAELDELAAEIEHAARPERARLRDELANLRGAPTVTLRLQLLEQFVALAPLGKDPELGAELRRQAIAIACADSSGAVRARAVQLAQPTASAAPMFWQTALADSSPLVRRYAAPGAAEQLGPDAVPLLRARLDLETDAAAFAALHQALVAVVAPAREAPRADPATAAGRAALVAFWQEQRNP